MPGKRRRQHSAEFKYRVALEAIKGQQTISALANEYDIHPNLVTQWRRELLEKGPEVFGGSKSERAARAQAVKETELHEQIGRLKMELEWLKKSCPVRVRPSER